jgi:hypothetical protein
MPDHINAHVWLLDEEEPGQVLLDLGDDGSPVGFNVVLPGGTNADPIALSDLAERLVTLHNAELAQDHERRETAKTLEAWIDNALDPTKPL